MYKRVPLETKNEIVEKVKHGMVVSEAAKQYAVSDKTIYAWLSNQTRPEISVVAYNRMKKENEELKRIIGIITLELERGKKIEIVNISCNKKLIANCMHLNHKNIYHHSKMFVRDLVVKDKIEKNFETNPSYGHRRLALDLKMSKKKILRVMHEFNLKPPRLWYQKKYITQSDATYQDVYTNLLKDTDITQYAIGDIWSSDLTYIKFQEKFIYLATIQDIVSKEIIGFNLSNQHNADVVLKTLKEAMVKNKKPPIIFHSDRGREFLSEQCITFLENQHVKISVSDPGSPW